MNMSMNNYRSRYGNKNMIGCICGYMDIYGHDCYFFSDTIMTVNFKSMYSIRN